MSDARTSEPGPGILQSFHHAVQLTRMAHTTSGELPLVLMQFLPLLTCWALLLGG